MKGHSLVDGTPIVDVKPYLPFAKALPDARAGFAQQASQADMPVSFTPEAQQQLALHLHQYPHLREFR
ncbi:hypothetical protein EWM58_06535 [Candidatus Erwinia dacicola]|nr:hypothetical protein [Candidatus Erwinia dacicola]